MEKEESRLLEKCRLTVEVESDTPDVSTGRLHLESRLPQPGQTAVSVGA